MLRPNSILVFRPGAGECCCFRLSCIREPIFYPPPTSTTHSIIILREPFPFANTNSRGQTPKLRNPPRVYTIQYLEPRTRAPSAPPLPAFHHPLPGSCKLRDEPHSSDACYHTTNRYRELTWPTRKSLMPFSPAATQAPGPTALRLSGSQASPIRMQHAASSMPLEAHDHDFPCVSRLSRFAPPFASQQQDSTAQMHALHCTVPRRLGQRLGAVVVTCRHPRPSFMGPSG